jgi:nucleoside recognition membrane protein YjiH
MLGASIVGPAFFVTVGIVLFAFTPIFTWIGYIFWPFMRIVIPAHEAVTASSGAAIGFLDNTLPSLLVATGEWTLRIRYMMAVIPVTAVVFLSSFVPCIMATSLPVKFGHLVIIWLERMILSIIFAALISLILFPAGAV